MKTTYLFKKIICFTMIILLMTSISNAYPMDPVYKDGILWTYGENMKVGDILYDDEDRLYVSINDSVCSIRKDLEGSFRYEKPYVWDEYHGAGRGNEVEYSRISHRDHKIFLDEIEIMDVTSYEEEAVDRFSEHYKNDMEHMPENVTIGIWGEEFSIDENTKLADITIITQGYVPPPYTPMYNFVFLIRNGKATLLDTPKDRNLEKVMRLDEQKLVLSFSMKYFKSNTGRDIGVLDSEYGFTLLSKTLGIHNLQLVRAFEDELYFEVFTPNFYPGEEGASPDKAKGIYKYNFGTGKSELVAKSIYGGDEHYAFKKDYFASSERNIYAVNGRGVINVLTGKTSDDSQFLAKDKIYEGLKNIYDAARSQKERRYVINGDSTWYIEEGNLYRESEGKLKHYTGKDFIPEVEYEWISKLFKDEAGNLYVLKDSGLYILEPGDERPRQIADLATYRIASLGYEGKELCVDSSGTVWFLTRDEVLYSYKGGKLEKVKDYGTEGYEYISNYTHGAGQDGVYVFTRKSDGLKLETLVLSITGGQMVEKTYGFDVSDHSNRYTLEKIGEYDDPESGFSYLTTYLSGWQKYGDSIFIRANNGVIRINDGEMKFFINDDVMGGDMSFAIKDENEVVFARNYGFISARVPSAGDVIGSYKKSGDVHIINGVALPVYKVDGSNESYVCAEALVLAGYGHEWNGEKRIVRITENREFDANTPSIDDQGSIYYSDVILNFLGTDIDSYNVGGYSLVNIDDLK